MHFDEQKLLKDLRAADTEDLIDRVTAFRAGMEPEAVDLIEAELHRRGVGMEKIGGYREECLRECLFNDDGTAKVCSFCRRPAVKEGWGWHRLMGKIPIMPRWLRYCKQHSLHK
jgi:hypothetical protein